MLPFWSKMYEPCVCRAEVVAPCAVSVEASTETVLTKNSRVKHATMGLEIFFVCSVCIVFPRILVFNVSSLFLNLVTSYFLDLLNEFLKRAISQVAKSIDGLAKLS